MIAVIADDFTGAAEIGGVGLKYGLKVVIETQFKKVDDVDLLVVVADTRLLSEEVAYENTKKIIANLLQQKPEYIFKKIDSVLRGNITSEIIAQLEVTGKKRALMVAGNPSFGRIIVDGKYFVDEIPLAETSFSNDPDFPVHSSFVTDIIKSDEVRICSINAGAEIPKDGIVIGDVKDQNEMDCWAEGVGVESVVAGGAGFFDALMSKRLPVKHPNYEGCLELGAYTLFIFGSKYPKSATLPMGLSERDTVKLNMPDQIYMNSEFQKGELVNWANQIVAKLKSKKNVIITVDQNFSQEQNLAERIRKNIAETVKLVSEQVELSDLLIEGGATTSEILKAIGIKNLFPGKLINPGIIQMNTQEYPNLTLTTKPGSYPWPENIVLSVNCKNISNKT